jgi:hypothetical protein
VGVFERLGSKTMTEEGKNMYYPKWCFVANETITRNNMKKYDEMREKWYKKALELYPNYYEMNRREKLKIEDEVNEAVGFKI